MKKVNAYELALRLGVIIEEMEETAKKIDKLDNLRSFKILVGDTSNSKILKTKMEKLEHDYLEIKKVVNDAKVLENALEMNKAIKDLEENEKKLNANKISERQAQKFSEEYDEEYHTAKEILSKLEPYVDLQYKNK